MFKVKAKSKVIKDVLSMTSALVKEIKLEVSSDKIAIKGVDPAHIAMFSMELDKSAFLSYEASDCEIGIPLDKFKDALKTVGNETEMEYDESKGRLVIRSDNLTRRMNVVDMSLYSSIRIPNLELNASAKIPLSEIGKGITASNGVSDTVRLTMDGRIFAMSCGSESGDMMDMVLTEPALTDIAILGKETTLIPLDYFTLVIKAIPFKDAVVSMGTDYPVRISFDTDGIKGMYLIAPRIESDE